MAGLRALTHCSRGDRPENGATGESANCWMKEWSIQVDCVVVTATPVAEVYQAVLAEVSNHYQNCSLRQVKVAGDLLDRGSGQTGT